MKLSVQRKSIRFDPDSKRIIARFFNPGDDRAPALLRKIINLSEEDAKQALNNTLREFSNRHRNISKTFENHFGKIKHFLEEINVDPDTLSLQTKLLIGSYFTNEYSIESAAFFNPSMVEDPDQTGLEEGQKRIIVSFRATGEGHISSVVFRRGIIDADNNLTFRPVGKRIDEAEVIKKHVYTKKTFRTKLHEIKIHNDISDVVMDKLGETFLYRELRAAIDEITKTHSLTDKNKNSIEQIIWLADAHYELTFSLDTDISERVIFPVSESESRGIEDARFVRFTEDDGSIKYYATYTAYNGFAIIPKLLETEDFYRFKIRPIHGRGSSNKNFALFPRKVKGRYVMLSRLDGINNYIMYSDNMTLWNDYEKLDEPEHPWEFIQIGNSGSPIETKKGWLLITHGVGPMRKYCISASLLSLKNPSKVIGRLKEPLMVPNEEEREGYVPNVVYSCGSIVHNNEIFIPYAMSDYSSSIATVNLDKLLERLSNKGKRLKNGLFNNKNNK